MSLIVQKFGGTSVANTERLKNVADIVTKTAQAGNQVVVVVSAQGDTTDDLIVKAAELNDRPSKREMDVLLNTGEMISMSLLAMAIQKLGFPVVSLTGWQIGLETNSNYSDARIKRIAGERLKAELDNGRIVILCINHAAIIPAFKSIFVAAFDPQAILGGAAGITVRQAMRYGVARGLFSNEAGMGSTPHAHALAKVNRPQDQGEIAIVSVFIDTFIVLTLTAMVILTSGMLNPGAPDGLQGTELAQAAFKASLGSAGMAFVAICMLFFAFSTIIGWYFFGEQNVKAMFGHKAVKVYAAIVVICIVIGSALHVDLVWNLSDLFNGLMVFPNLIALLALSGLVAKAAHDKDIMK